MAVTTQQQMDGSEDLSNTNSRSRTFVYKGAYSSLQTTFNGLSRGSAHEGMVVLSARLQPCPGDLGLLSVVCVPNDTTVEDDTPTQTPLKDTWQIKSVRNDVSIFGYCGDSAAYPQRADIEAWQKEPDGNLAKGMQYRASDGTIVTISDTRTQAIIAKICEGKEAVMRFYPLVIRTRVYSNPPLVFFENLNKIDTPPWSKLPSGYSWLKCQDDLVEDTSGQWNRIEAWMGSPSNGTTQPGWDTDFYGPNAWPMPLGSI